MDQAEGHGAFALRALRFHGTALQCGRWSRMTQRRILYQSSNADCWYLCRSRSNQVVVKHEPKLSSGGKASQIEVRDFLAEQNQGPEHQALLELIGQLVPFVGLVSGASFKNELDQCGAIAIFRDIADLLSHWPSWRDLSTMEDEKACASGNAQV
jgi:hypothetical protein